MEDGFQMKLNGRLKIGNLKRRIKMIEHPITKEVHRFWRSKIKAEFSYVDFSTTENYLSLIKYINESPEKFYSREAFATYSTFLDDLSKINPELLRDLLKEYSGEINISNKSLFEVNKRPIHDVFFPKDDNTLFDFIDREIHYNYLKVLEGAFYHLALLPAKTSRSSRKAGTDGIDLYNAILELEKGEFSFLSALYNSTVRNGIAHGKVVFKDTQIDYFDKKGNKYTLQTKEIVKMFDSLLDIVNGFMLALKLFYFTNQEFLVKHSIEIPQSILIEELQLQANGPAWKVINCVESYAAFKEQKQLMIYIDTDFWDYGKVLFGAFRTAVLAESFFTQYDRLFVSIKCKHAWPGWAAFDAKKIKIQRENYPDNPNYAGVLENNMVFFVPKVKLPRFIYKIGTIRMSFGTMMPLKWEENYTSKFPKPFVIREVKAHAKKFFSVVEDPSVVISKEFQSDIEELVRKNYRGIVNKVIKHAKRKSGLLDGVKYKPVKFIRVFVYEKDMRVRKLRNSGLIEELVCTIGFNTSDKIPMIDIIGGTPEQKGKYRIVWNKKWLEKKSNLQQLP